MFLNHSDGLLTMQMVSVSFPCFPQSYVPGLCKFGEGVRNSAITEDCFTAATNAHVLLYMSNITFAAV